MRYLLTLLILGILFSGCKNEGKKDENPLVGTENSSEISQQQNQEETTSINITPISHATAVINWGDATFYIDPVGGAEAFEGMEKPDFILVTDIHGDHMSAETLQALNLKEIPVIVPQAVKENLPKELDTILETLENGANTKVMDFNIEAIPMYNLPEDPEAFHTKGRGNGYVLEKNGKRLYIAGDTEDIPEMRNLENIDLALIPMNLPYTMTVEAAADGVLAFAPKKVIPYHFRGKDGFADVEKFKTLVNKGNPEIEVEMLDWYPDKEK